MKNYQLTVLITSLILTVIGIVFVFESSTAESFATFGSQYHYLTQHLIGLAFAIGAFCIGISVPPSFWIKISPISYLIGILMLVLVFIPGIGLSLNGANRWISIAGLGFQPIEFFKFSLVTFYSHWLSKHQRFGPFLFLTSIPALLVILQPDLGSLLVVCAIACTLYFIAGGRINNLVILGLLGLPLLLITIITSPYRLNRLTTFLNPDSDPLGASFHIRQITVALGRGGLFGQGIGESHQKFSYIPEASTDSIFAIIAEEVGFIGSIAIFLIYATFLFSAYAGVSKSTQPQQVQLLGFGIILWIGLQLILNLSAVVGLVPLTGVPLPFVSFGRSSLVMILFVTGILIKIGKRS